MPRKKKVETEVKEEIIVKEPKKVDYGTGWARKNNMIQAGVKEDQEDE